MNRQSPLQVVVILGVASAATGFLLQLLERVFGVKPGALKWVSAMVASSVAGTLVGRRGRRLYAITPPMASHLPVVDACLGLALARLHRK